MYTIISIIMVILGIFGTWFNIHEMTITQEGYTWAPPFTAHETLTIVLLAVSILLIAGGIFTFIFGKIKANKSK